VIRGDLLGWRPFQELLARFTATAAGGDAARALQPGRDLDTIHAALHDTTEARRALAAEGPPPWAGLPDVRGALEAAAPEGAVLDGPALAALAAALATAARLARYAAAIRPLAPGLSARWETLPGEPGLAGHLTAALDAEGRLLDAASPRLRSLRRRLATLRAELEARLGRLLDQPAIAPALQDRYVTVRHGRYVVPIRDEARRSVRGIIHDRSQSGATVFVEPEELVPLNNELTRTALEERAEEARILDALTRQVRLARPALVRLVDGLAGLDVIFARAALAERLGASPPAVTDGADLDLRGARHPLLVAQAWAGGPPAVPVDLAVPAARPGLVISGPNAGGKTVALETAGLLVLMAHAGCHLPAEAGGRVPLVDQVLAVIGDEQSLDQNLSTFSSFVAHVRDILARAGPRSLVLLDELGAGTDPQEGAALGVALLEALLDRGARVIATTHLEPLKVAAQIEPRLQNATVAFDAERLAPTFRLEYGHPGPSYALLIGERLGLPAAVIARARVHVGEAGRQLEQLLADLHARERDAEVRLREAARQAAEATAAAAAARAALATAAAEAAHLRERARAEAQALLGDARRQAGRELDRLRAADATRRDAQAAYQRLRAAEAALAPAAGAPAAADGAASGHVRLRPLGVRGRVLAEHGDTVTVEAGQLTVRVPRHAVEPVAAAPGPPAPRPEARAPARDDVPRELRLLGLASDEARAAVDKFLDDALLAGHRAVRLVHGKGTGALRRAVEACLRAHPLVERFRPAEPAAGGAGVTVAELADR
jgi:DNA mismatch repair protein MutS2